VEPSHPKRTRLLSFKNLFRAQGRDYPIPFDRKR
jgi:hypothetical protein